MAEGAAMPAACARASGALLLIVAAAMLLAGCGSSAKPSSREKTASSGHKSQALVPIGAGLDGPAGLHATAYAKGPPTLASFAFDPQGRLWLAAAGLQTHTQDGVYLLAKPGQAAEKVISGLNDPLGLDWDDGKLYVSSVGRVDAYWGFDGTRFTQHRQILHGPLSGGENNLLVTAPDGRLLMGVSATCDHCVPTSKWDGAIVSFRPNGSELRLYAGRIRAPVGLAYFPGTSDLFVTMNQRDDLGAATPGDWLSLVREGQKWGFPDCYGQGGPQCAGMPAPVATLDPHAAVGGVAFATGQLGPSVGTAAIVAEWNVAKVQRVALTKSGSGFKGTVMPFLTGMAHPLAVTMASDGSLLVGDWQTGTIYRISRSG